MKDTKSQINQILEYHKHGLRISVIDYTDARYLVLWQSFVYSNKIVNELAFEFAELIEKKQEWKTDKKQIQEVINKCIVEWQEVSKDDFNQYTIDGDITFIEWHEYWVGTGSLIKTIKLVSEFITTPKFYIYNKDLLVIADEFGNLIMIKQMTTLPKSLF